MSAELPAESITSTFIPVTRPEVASVDVDGEVVLYDDTAGVMHRLNPTASVLWDCMDGTESLAGIAEDVAHAYRADFDVVLADVVGVTRSLGDKGLLVGVRRSPDDPGAEAVADREGADVDDGGEGPFVVEPPSP